MKKKYIIYNCKKLNQMITIKRMFITPLIFLLITITFISSCSDIQEGATLYFTPEYDYMDGFDIFPSQEHLYASKAFDNANTVFSPYYSNSGIAFKTSFTTETEMLRFADSWGDCEKDSNGVLIRDSLGRVSFIEKAYIVGVNDLDNKPISNALGLTYNGGVESKVKCFIFVGFIKSVADTSTYDSTKFIQATVVHELGHARANLTHYCFDGGLHARDINNHSAGVCIMSATLPKSDCEGTDDDYDVLLYPPSFCNKCIKNLKKITW